LDKYSGRLENNKRKAQAVIKESYNYEVWIFGKDLEIIKYDARIL
jgi:hypothetical protein